MSDDLINGLVHAIAGLMVLDHVRVLRRDRQVKGISIPTQIFFLGWGVWSLKYYSGLEQWYSSAGGALIAVANLLWFAHYIWYERPHARLRLDSRRSS